ncbi:MAG: amidohydrolase family protein, partial [Clostridium sp.]
MNILIKNGFLVDGSGNLGDYLDVIIKDKKIFKIGKDLKAEGLKVIDAKGLVVAPGFIDTHSHSDLKIYENPYNQIKI